jgi:Tol biopolymer transport system component
MIRWAVTTLAAMFLIGMLAVPAFATFPGKNGRIAFIQDGEVFTINPDGSDIKQLTHLGPDNSASWPAWSADGKQIVFNEFPPPDGIGEIWAMNADGTNQHLVLAEKNFAENRPSFSPDGSKTVFSRCKLLVGDGSTCAIHTVGVTGTGLTRIVDYHPDSNQRSPMFSPDGTKIAFIISTDAAAGFLGVTYIVNADGTNLHRITEPEPCFIRPDWSPDGNQIVAFAHFCNPRPEEIAVINSDGTGSIQYLTHNGKDYFGGSHDRNPAFSPDGNFIVFERNAPDFSGSAIYLMKSDGTGLKPIASVRHTRKQLPKRQLKFAARRLTKLEEGGSVPRWGVAPQ